MKVTSNNLTNICRLLFAISRDTDNDLYFMENDILGKGITYILTMFYKYLNFKFSDSMLNAAKRLDFKENSESVIYYCGTVKNLSENTKILKQLSLKNLEELLARIVKDLSKFVIFFK